MPLPSRLTTEDIPDLCQKMRGTLLTTIVNAKMGHVGGDLSVIDILGTLYFSVLRVDPADPHAESRDRFVLSKGHCSVALYTTLAYAGFLPIEELASFAAPLSRLNGHPCNRKLPGVETSTGPLGHGLPVATGIAIGGKLSGADWRVFVVVGDGELQEGSNWESMMSAAHQRLDNLTLIVDRNHLQQGDRTSAVTSMEPLAERFAAFGWETHEVDGHDHAALESLLSSPNTSGRPRCLIAATVKGQGVSFIRDRVEWHHKVPSREQLAAALDELEVAS